MDNHSIFQVPGIRPRDLEYLKQVGNYRYYKRKVLTLRNGRCEFCGVLDSSVNRVVVEMGPWRAWTNVVAPLVGQKYQFVIAPLRHSEHFHHLNNAESVGLTTIIGRLNDLYDLTGYAMFLRSGDPSINARSVAHTHMNIVIADGTQDVKPILGKSRETVAADLRVLVIFEKMRLMEEQGNPDPFNSLPCEEQELVCKRL